MEGRWTIWTTAKCDRDCTLKCADAGGLPRSATPVVPCDDAAIERAVEAVSNLGVLSHREYVETAFRAAASERRLEGPT